MSTLVSISLPLVLFFLIYSVSNSPLVAIIGFCYTLVDQPN
jgi:hypothetical protein